MRGETSGPFLFALLLRVLISLYLAFLSLYSVWENSSATFILNYLPEERLLCPVRAVRTCLDATASLSPHPRSLFVSPCCPPRSVSKNALSYFLRQVISSAGALRGDPTSLPRAHSIGGVATSATFLHS